MEGSREFIFSTLFQRPLLGSSPKWLATERLLLLAHQPRQLSMANISLRPASAPPLPTPPLARQPHPRRMVAAAHASCATSLAVQSRLGSLREKWKDWPQPHSYRSVTRE